MDKNRKFLKNISLPADVDSYLFLLRGFWKFQENLPKLPEIDKIENF